MQWPAECAIEAGKIALVTQECVKIIGAGAKKVVLGRKHVEADCFALKVHRVLRHKVFL